MPKLIEIEGLGPVYAEKLKQYGVRSFDDLLKNAATHKGRKEMSAAIGVSEKNLLEWATLADLMRIRGISLAYAVLLAACGVDNTHELALRDPQKLHDQMIGVNKKKNLVKRMPSVEEIKAWTKQARKSRRTLEY